MDCSSTITCEFNTGIQRVVRNLCEQASLAENHAGEALAVYGQAGKLYAAQSLHPQKPPRDLVSTIVQSRVARRYRKLAGTVNRIMPGRRFQKLFLPQPGRAGIFKLPKLALQQLEQWSLPKPKPQPTVDVKVGDVLLMADASWMVPNWECIDMAKQRGAIVGNLVYDLIPLTHPQFFPAELVECFTQWFQRAVQTSDFFLCISEHVASQVQQQMLRAGRDASDVHTLCRAFPLGANLTTRNVEGQPTDRFQELFCDDRQQNPHLVVGTLEPRKNHSFILDAFDRLWKSGSCERLCIVGRSGWNCDETIDRIKKHPEFERKLMLFNDASDADVGFAYCRAKSLIMASHTEGFGLPIVEALEFGQRVLASSTPIHREVGRDQVSYFDIDGDCDSLVQLLHQCEAQAHSRPSSQASGCVQWSESYEAILHATRDFRQHCQSSRDSTQRAA